MRISSIEKAIKSNYKTKVETSSTLVGYKKKIKNK